MYPGLANIKQLEQQLQPTMLSALQLFGNSHWMHALPVFDNFFTSIGKEVVVSEVLLSAKIDSSCVKCCTLCNS